MAIKLPRVNNNPLTPQDFNEGNQIIEEAVNALQDSLTSGGTVTSVSENDTDVAELFVVSISNASSTPVITFQRVSKAQKLFFATPNNASGKPTMRSITAEDLPVIGKANGGIGITETTNNKVLRTDGSGDYVLGELKSKDTKTEVAIVGNDLVIDILAANIEIDSFKATNGLSIAKGGSGAKTAQAAIDNLTQVSSSTVGYILTVVNDEGGIKRAVFQAIPNVGTSKLENNAVTFAKFQTIGAKTLLGNDTTGSAIPKAITLDANLLLIDGVLKQRQSIISVKTAVSGSFITYTMTSVDGTIYGDATSAAFTVILPDTSTLVGGEIFTVSRLNSGANTVTVRNFNTSTEQTIGASIETTIALSGRGHSLTFQYIGTFSGKPTFVIIGKIA